MSKYIKLEDAIHNINLEVTGRKEYTGDMKANLFFALDDLPTIEVSEDCISRDWVLNRLTKYQKDYTFNELDDWQNTVVEWITTDIEDAPSVVPCCDNEKSNKSQQELQQAEVTAEQSSKVENENKCDTCCQYKIGFEEGKLEMIRMIEDALKGKSE